MLTTPLRGIYLVVAVIAVGLLILLLMMILAAGFDLPSGSFMTSDESVLVSLMAPLRTFLFRNALRNTFVVFCVALTLAYLLGMATVTLVTHCGRSRGVMGYLLLLPLATPVVLAMPAWRQLFLGSPAIADGVIPAMIAVGFIQAWRILPFATLFILLAYPLNRQRTAFGLTFCFTAYVIVGDVGGTLLFKGGQPFNATHVLASWIYQTAIAAAMPGHAAIMALGLMVLLAMVAWGFIHIVSVVATTRRDHRVCIQPGGNPSTRQRQRGSAAWIEHSSQALGDVLLAGLVIVMLLLPLALVLTMTRDWAHWPVALNELFVQHDYGYWLANTILLASITALVAILIAIPIGRRMAAWQSAWSLRLSQGMVMLAMVILPVAYLPLAWMQTLMPLIDARWLLTSLYIASTLCIGIWLVSMVTRSAKEISRRMLASWLALLSYLLVTNEMASSLALSTGATQAQTLNSGLATRLTADVTVSMTTLGLAILLPMLLLSVFYWWLVRSGILPLLKVTSESR